MNNFKKLAAIVLAIAMVCSMCVMANAATFKDQAKIENATAAAVLSEINVIEGYEDGNFKPEGILTRAEGAAIIARLLLGDKAEDQMAAGNPFTDVKSTDWHAGYIAYCVAEGIIAGYGNGTFGPNDKLTVVQFGKMLLTALGYEAAREGFTGAEWTTAVGKYINKLSLTEYTTVNLNDNCTRQVAAQMALNTLKSDMVEYASGSTTIKGEGIEVTLGGSAATKVENNASTETIIDDNVMQFAERYFTLLRYDGSNSNNFGRPSVNAWSIRGTELGTEESEADLLKTFSGTVTRGQMFDLIGKRIVKDTNTTTTVYVDGETVDVAATAIFDDSNALRSTEIGTGLTGNGVVTEVYMQETEAGYDITVVIINTYVAVAESDYDHDTEELEVTVYGTVVDEDKVSSEDFDVKGYKEGDYLLVTVDAGEIASVAYARTVSGTVDSYAKATDLWLNTITVNGKKYSYSHMQADTGEGTAENVTPATRGAEATLVLDQYGYVITFAEAETIANYLYLTEVVSESTFSGSKQNYLGAVYFTDGKYEEIAVGKIDGATTNLSEATAGWYTYSLTSEGKYALNTVTTNKTVGGEIDGGHVVFHNGNRANAKTTFVVVDEEGESKVFTGYKGMPDVTAVDLVVDVIVDKDTNFATFVFVTSKNKVEITGTTKDNSTVVFIYNKLFTQSVNEKDEEFYTCSYVLVNGVKTSINTTAEYEAGLYIGVEYDNVTGYISKMLKVDGENFTADAVDTDGDSLEAFYLAVAEKHTIIYEGGVLDVNDNTYDIAEDIEIVLIEGTAYSKISMSKLTSMSNKKPATYAGIVNVEGQVTTLFVTI